MKKILFISNRLKVEDKNGASIVAKRNFENLKEIYSDKKIIFFKIEEKGKIKKLINEVCFDRMEDVDFIEEKKILLAIKKYQINEVFLDTSCYGYLAEKIKKKYGEEIKIITFCHDISKKLYESISKKEITDKFKEKIKYFRKKNLIRISERNEKLTFKYSNTIITLNKRDSKLLLEEYGHFSDIEIPVTFPIKKNIIKLNKIQDKKNFTLLFVGVANFLPNIHGLDFFTKEVMPYINCNLYIVGKGMEIYRKKYESKNVKVIGTVESLDKYYLDADAVIAPIFLGGGMKVKTAEALMYGKTIFGTNEAFEGYEIDFQKVGGICNTSKDFIEKINKHIKNYNGNKQNDYSKKVFEKKYSYESSKLLFEKVLK